MIQDVVGVSSMNPDRKKLLDSLQVARERAGKQQPVAGKLAHV